MNHRSNAPRRALLPATTLLATLLAARVTPSQQPQPVAQAAPQHTGVLGSRPWLDPSGRNLPPRPQAVPIAGDRDQEFMLDWNGREIIYRDRVQREQDHPRAMSELAAGFQSRGFQCLWSQESRNVGVAAQPLKLAFEDAGGNALYVLACRGDCEQVRYRVRNLNRQFNEATLRTPHAYPVVLVPNATAFKGRVGFDIWDGRTQRPANLAPPQILITQWNQTLGHYGPGCRPGWN